MRSSKFLGKIQLSLYIYALQTNILSYVSNRQLCSWLKFCAISSCELQPSGGSFHFTSFSSSWSHIRWKLDLESDYFLNQNLTLSLYWRMDTTSFLYYNYFPHSYSLEIILNHLVIITTAIHNAEPVRRKLPRIECAELLQLCTIFLFAKWVFKCMLIGKREKLPLKTECIHDCILGHEALHQQVNQA